MSRAARIAFAVILACVAPGVAGAASYGFSPAAATYPAGTSFTAYVTVNASDQAINAVSGRFTFPADRLRVTGISKSGSVIDIWPQEPAFSNADGSVAFEGIVLNPGYQGASGRVLAVTFRTLVAGPAPVTFASGAILANDGKGTNLILGLARATYVVSAALPPKPGATPAPPGTAPAAPAIEADRQPPYGIVVKEVKGPDQSDPSVRLELAAEDDQGAVRFEYQNEDGAWSPLETSGDGYYLLNAWQPGEQRLKIRALDGAGNATEAEVSVYRRPLPSPVVATWTREVNVAGPQFLRRLGSVEGIAEPGRTVRVSFAGEGDAQETVAEADERGRWEAAYPELVQGEWKVTAISEDERGARSLPTDEVPVTANGIAGMALPFIGWGLVGFFMIVMAWFLLVTEYRFVGKVQEWLQRMTRRE